MAQTTVGMAFTAAFVFVSTDGSTWTSMNPVGASVAQAGGERATGEQNTFDGYAPIVKGGDRASTDVTVRFVYTETASDPWDVVEAVHNSASPTLYVQWRPKAAGNWFKTGAGILTNLVYPQGEAGSGEVVMSEFVVKCAALTEAAAST